MTFYLKSDLKAYFTAKTPLFDQVMALQGDCYRQLEGRKTQRIMLGEKSYFIKQHEGVGWKEIVKNLLQGRLPVLSAKNEWVAIQKLNSLGISVPIIAGYGKDGINPAYLKSFVLMEELTNIISLETLCQTWNKHPPEFRFKKKLIEEVAHIARTLHENGINHRDFYICHFLLEKNAPIENMKLFLIDLHRAAVRSVTPERWIIKDLAGLYFSSKECGLTKRDYFRFMRAYTAKSLSEIVQKNQIWKKVIKRGERLYQSHRAQ